MAAMAFDGFSIRGFTAKMRAVDAAKCWPFKSDDGAGAAPKLPPIGVAEFRWWRDELARLRRAESERAAPPRRGEIASVPVPVAVPGAGAGAKPKSRPTKKRSIAEIFAVAPQLEDREEIIPAAAEPRRTRKKRRIAKRVSEDNNAIKKKKMTKKKNAIKNAQKPDLQTLASFRKRLKKKSTTGVMNSDRVCEKRLTAGKCSTSSDKQTVHEAPSRMVEREREPSPPIRSILKNQATNSEPKQAICEANPCGIQTSEKHVRFSEKDDILGSNKSDTRSPEKIVGNLSTDGIVSSSEIAPTLKEKMICVEINSSEDDASPGTDYGITEVQPPIRKERSADAPDVELPSSLRPPVTRVIFHEKGTSQSPFYDSNNLHALEESNQTTALTPASARIPSQAQVGGSVSRTSVNCNESMSNHVHNPYTRVYEISSAEHMHRFPELVSESENHRLGFQSHPEIAHDPGFHHHEPFCCRRPMDLIGGLWEQNTVVVRERSSNGEYFGLPLNSQGELIQSSSRGNGIYRDTREMDMIRPLRSLFPTHNPSQPSTADYLGISNKHFAERDLPNDRVNLFVSQNYARENHGIQVPARLGVTYWENTGRPDFHGVDFEKSTDRSFRPLGADLNLMSVPFEETRPYSGHFPNRNVDGNIQFHPKENYGKTSLSSCQPTMRLMGKDVPIGKSSKEMQGSEDGKFWTDKEIVVEQSQTGVQEWIPQGKCKETVTQCLDFRHENSQQNHFLVRAPASGVSGTYRYWQEKDSFENSGFASGRYVNPNSFPVPREPHFWDFFVPQTEAVPVSSRIPVRDFCQNSDWRQADLTHRQDLPVHFSNPGFDLPFMSSDSRANHAQSPWFHQNSKNLPYWLMSAKQQGNIPIASSQPIVTGTSKQPQHISSRTNIMNSPSVYHSAEASYMPGSASIAVPPFVPIIAGVNPATTAGFINRKKVKERPKPKGSLGIKDLYPFKKSTNKKDLTKLSLDNSVRAPNLERCSENRSGEVRFDMARDDASTAGFRYSGETRGNGTSVSEIEASRAEYVMGRSGPVKLSAGAKHILKPNQNLDFVETFVPIHSTIPFSGEPPDESQKKATKIYRF